MSLVNLLLKDLREHGRLLSALFAAMVFALLLLAFVFQSSQTVLSVLEIARSFCSGLIPIAALVLGQRLIVSEYTGQTIRFLEAFPVSRFSLLVVKYLLGLFFLLFVTWFVLGVVVAMSLETENMDSRFAMILSLRTGVAVLVIWSIVFCLSFFGSLKIPLYALLLIIVYIVQTQTQWDMTEHGPGGLLSSRLFAYESYDFPWLAIVESLLFALVFSFVGFAVALSREGRFVTHFARSMDRNEYVTLIILMLASLTLLQLLEARETRVSYRFTAESVLRSKTIPLSIQYSDKELFPIAQQQLRELEMMLGKLQWFLDDIILPQLRVSIEPVGSYPAHIGDAAALAGLARLRIEDVDGVLLKSSLNLNDVQHRVRFHSRLLQELFLSLSNKRASFEPQAWLMNGFAWWWALHWNDERFFNEPERAAWAAISGLTNDQQELLSAPTIGDGASDVNFHDQLQNIAEDLQVLSSIIFHAAAFSEPTETGAKLATPTKHSTGRNSLFHHWYKTLEVYGQSAGAALSYSLIDSVLSNRNEALGVGRALDRTAVRTVLSDSLAVAASLTSMVTIKSVLNPLSLRLESATGRNFDEITDDWQRTLADRAELLVTQSNLRSSDLLRHLASDSLFIAELQDMTESGALSVGPNALPISSSDELLSWKVLSDSSQCYMLYQVITAFDQHIEQRELHAEDVSCDADFQSYVADKGFSEGERVFVALEMVSKKLLLPLRLKSARLVIN